jgi:hypothetical protein
MMLGVDPNQPARAFRGTDPAALRAMLGAEAFERMQRGRPTSGSCVLR